MSKLYLFGIGGTGSRVIKSLTMLMASGVDLGYDVVPIIIDPDQDNGDLLRTISILNAYEEASNKIGLGGFFKNKIEKLTDSDSYQMNLLSSDGVKFKNYINYSLLNNTPNNKALVDLLFSDKNLDADMTVGFKGNPNIGSVVLNQISSSVEFGTFSQSINPDDRIFIISSIFGGTGAAGFPLVLKNIRESEVANLANAGTLKKSIIGALSILPYFNIQQGEEGSEVDSSTFMQKTKAALSYYNKHVVDKVNDMYYLGDNPLKMYEHNEGQEDQKNNAHLIEFLGALSIIDFAHKAKEYEDSIGDTQKTCFHQFSLPDPTDAKNKSVATAVFNNVTLLNFNSWHGVNFRHYMTQFHLLQTYIHLLQINSYSYLSQPWAKENWKANFFTSNLMGGAFTEFSRYYKEWLDELAENSRSFTPFVNDYNRVKADNLYDALITDYKASKGIFTSKNIEHYNNTLNSVSKGIANNSQTSEAKFFKLFFDVTNKIVNDKFPNFKL